MFKANSQTTTEPSSLSTDSNVAIDSAPPPPSLSGKLDDLGPHTLLGGRRAYYAVGESGYR